MSWKRFIVPVTACGFLLGGAATVSASAYDQPAATTAATSVPAKDSITSYQIAPSGITQAGDFSAGLLSYLRTPKPASVWQSTLNANVVSEDKLTPSLRAKVNSTAGKVKALEADSPYPGATKLQDYPGNGANSTDKWVGDSGATLQRSWVQCADGKTAIGGGYQRADEGVAAIKNLQIVTSSPTQIKDGKEVYEPIAGDAAGSLKPNAWLVEGFNNGTADLIVRPSVVCANLN